MLQENRIIPLYFEKFKTFVGPFDSLGPRAMPEHPIGQSTPDENINIPMLLIQWNGHLLGWWQLHW